MYYQWILLFIQRLNLFKVAERSQDESIDPCHSRSKRWSSCRKEVVLWQNAVWTVLAGMQGGSDVVTGGWSTTIKFERIRVLVNLEMRRVPIGYALLRG